MIDTRFQIRDKLLITNASGEYNGTYICISEGRILGEINLVVQRTGRFHLVPEKCEMKLLAIPKLKRLHPIWGTDK